MHIWDSRTPDDTFAIGFWNRDYVRNILAFLDEPIQAKLGPCLQVLGSDTSPDWVRELADEEGERLMQHRYRVFREVLLAWDGKGLPV